MIRSYHDLEVYQKSYQLALQVHEATQRFPEYERRELGYQLRRAATSIPANIAEGYGRKNSAAEFKHFLRNAMGSCNEVRVLIDLAKDLKYLGEAEYGRLSKEYEVLSRQLYKLTESWHSTL